MKRLCLAFPGHLFWTKDWSLHKNTNLRDNQNRGFFKTIFTVLSATHAHTFKRRSLEVKMVIAKVRNSDYYNYHYSSPVIGLHVPNRGHKLQDESISRISYKPLPYQKELATHTDENAVTKSLKHDCYLHTEKTTTKECYSALPKDSSAPVHAKQISANDVADSKQHTIKKMANNFRYASSVFVKPDKRTLEPSHTTYQRYFTPVSLEFLKDKQADLVRRDVNASSNPGVRLSDPEVRSEYKYRFVMPKDALKGASDWKRDLSGVRGCAKLNVTHNTITGI